MTESDCKKYIAAAIPKDTANAVEIAGMALSKAISKVGRMIDVDFNRVSTTVTLTAGKSSYAVGKDILTDYGEIHHIEELWRNDQRDLEIKIKPMDVFNSYARGSTITGFPEIASYHSDNRILELFPIPNSAYEIWCYFRKAVSKYSDIPIAYQDVVCDEAIVNAKALTDVNVLLRLRNEGLKNIRDDSMTTWRGTVARTDRHLGQQNNVKTTDSHNLRND